MGFFKISLNVILMFICTGAFAQGFVENALLFSRTKPGGSARIQAMGGSTIALGGDYSSALANPAGLGMYNRSEFTFSPGLNFYSSDSKMTGHTDNQHTDSKTVFTIPGLSYIHHSPADKGGYLGGSFGVTMARINDFQNTFSYNGNDNTTSIIDYFEQMAQGYSIDPLQSPYDDTPLLNYDAPEGLAYLTYLITPYNEDPGNPSPVLPTDYITYFSELDTLGTDEVRSLRRNGNVNLRGAQYQWSFAYGGNYMDKLFFGASVGLTTLRYKYSSSYSESSFFYSSGYNSPLNDLNLSETIEIDGSGVNLTLGVIYRFVDFAQLGVSFVTPTFYTITDVYSARLRANWNIRANQDRSSEPIVSEYNITTPMKFSAGLALFISKYGVVSGDVEFVNYGKAAYSSDTPGVSFQLDNNDIKQYYNNVVNFRVGGEGRINIFRVRMGYNFQDNPYKNRGFGGTVTTLSAGVGVKLAKFFIDGTLLKTHYNSSYSPYSIMTDEDGSVGPVARLKNTLTSAMVTVGFSF